MNVQVIDSGSTANSYILRGEGGLILLDCGSPIRRTLDKLNYKLPDAVLITHEHNDHSRAVQQFLKRGVELYMTAGTARALRISRHNLNIVEAGGQYQIGGYKVEVLPSCHDAAEPVNFILSDSTDRLLYMTDTGEAPEVAGDFTKILIEANHERRALLSSPIDERQCRRIMQNHLCIDRTIEFLKAHNAAQIWLIHISTRHGDGEIFKQRILQETATEAQIFIAGR